MGFCSSWRTFLVCALCLCNPIAQSSSDDNCSVDCTDVFVEDTVLMECCAGEYNCTPENGIQYESNFTNYTCTPYESSCTLEILDCIVNNRNTSMNCTVNCDATTTTTAGSATGSTSPDGCSVAATTVTTGENASEDTTVTTGEATTVTPTATSDTVPSTIFTTENGILDILSQQPVYIGIAGGGLVLIIIVLFVCIGCCVLCSMKRGTKKKTSEEPAVQWSKSGEVKLLSIAEKAEEDSRLPAEQSEPEKEDAASGSDPKEDDKRVVTVSTFGFPEVSIEPSKSAQQENTEQKSEGEKAEELKQTANEEPSLSEAAAPGNNAAATSSAADVQADVKDATPESVKVGLTDVSPSQQSEEIGSTKLDTVQMETDTTPAASEGTGSVHKQPDVNIRPLALQDLDLGLQGMDSILSNEAIEKALGLHNASSESTQL